MHPLRHTALKAAGLMAVLNLLAGTGSADIVTYVDDKAGFLSATSATSATGPLVNTGAAMYTNHAFGSLTLSNGAGFYVSNIWTPDGTVNTIDFITFLNAWNALDPKADFNGDGTINTIDVIGYLNAFTAGC